MHGRRLAYAFMGALWVGGASFAAAETFNPKAHTDVVAKCFATFMTLGQGAEGLQPQSESMAYHTQSYRGSRRIKPYLDAVIGVVGSEPFYRRSAQSRLADSRMLNTLDSVRVNPARRVMVERLAADAEKCDRAMDAWGAPPFLGDLPARR